MVRQTTLCVLSAALLAICVGCDTSTHEDRRAYTARAGLMPGATPLMSSIYTKNQAEVKLAPERSISYQPLESFRGQPAPTSKAEGKTAKASGKSKRKSKSGKMGPIGKFKDMLSNLGSVTGTLGGAKPGDGPSPGAASPGALSSDDEEDADEADDEEDEDDGDDDEDEDEGDDDDTDDDDEDEDDGDDVSGGDAPGLGPQGPATGGGKRPGGGRTPR